MDKNIFWKNMLRRPLSTILFSVLLVLLSFGVTSRLVEYLVIHQEVERLAEEYQVIGRLNSDEGIITEGEKWISDSPYVKLADRQESYWGVMPDLYNCDLEAGNTAWDRHGCNEVVVRGMLMFIRQSNSGQDSNFELFFDVEERLFGYPDYVSEGRRIRVLCSSQLMKKLEERMGGLKENTSYLLRAYYGQEWNNYWPGYDRWVQDFAQRNYELYPLAPEGDRWLVEADSEEGKQIYHELLSDSKNLLDEVNRHSMTVFSVHDMSALPDVQDEIADMYLEEGRWLNLDDSEAKNPVCVLHQQFAQARGLTVGDTFELTFRHREEPYSAYVVGEKDSRNWQNYETYTQTFTIVGTYHFRQRNVSVANGSQEYNYVYIPAGILPEGLEDEVEDLWSGSFSFILTDPRVADDFRAEVEGPLEELGIHVQLLGTDYENFAVSADQLVETAYDSLKIFACVALVALVLIAFLYVRHNRRVFAIARALGVPAFRTVRWCLTPILFFGLLSVGVGCYQAWNYALVQAADTLSVFTIEGQENLAVSLSMSWLGGVWCVLLVFLLIFVGIGLLILAMRPVPRLLQGNNRYQKIKKEEPEFKGTNTVKESEPEVLKPHSLPNLSADTSEKNAALSEHWTVSCRFIFLHMRRSMLRTLLMFLVAVSFALALGWMRQSIVHGEKETERLYRSIPVTGLLTKKDISYIYGGDFGNGYISQNAVDLLVNTGFLQKIYLEAEGKVPKVIFNGRTETNRSVSLQATNDMEEYLGRHGIETEITYAPEYSKAIFDQDYEMKSSQALIIVPESWLKRYGLSYGDTCTFSLNKWTPTVTARIAGSYQQDSGTGGLTNNVFLPVWSMTQTGGRDGIFYTTVEFTLDSEKNADREIFRTEVKEALPEKGMGVLELELLLHDAELKQVVDPFEKNVELMRMLYPVMMVVSALVGGILMYLLLLQRTREATLLRVLGNSLQHTRKMLMIEPLILCLIGLLTGVFISHFMFMEISMTEVLPGITGYLLGCMAGIWLGTLHITNKAPLEVLSK